MVTEHRLHPTIYQSPWRGLHILLVGAGGNGSKFLVALKGLLHAWVAFGNKPFHVTVADGDHVGESNLARQAFYPMDLGRNKAEVLVERMHLSTGVAWAALPRHVTAQDVLEARPDIVVTCVDTREARAIVHEAVTSQASSACYWLDLGNRLHHGQVVLGSPRNQVNPRASTRLRTAAELFPEIIDTSLPDDDVPSCSTIEALERQDLFINDLLVAQGANLLWRLLRDGRLTYHGVYINALTGNAQPMPIDPALWRRLRRQGERVLQAA